MPDDTKMDEILKKLQKLDSLPDSLKIVEALVKGNSSTLEKIENEFKDKLNEIKVNIDKRFVEVLAETKKNSSEIKSVHCELKEDFESIKKSTEILISDLPENLNMSLTEFYQKVGSAIGFGDGSNADIPVPPRAKLIQIKNGKKKSSTVLMRFATIFDKSTFMANYFKDSKLLNLNKLGFNENKRLYMSHNLPQNKYKIFKRALERKKAGVFDAVRLSDYFEIKVRVPGEAKFRMIKTIEDVNAVPAPVPVNNGQSSSSGGT